MMSDRNIALYDAIVQHQADLRLYEMETQVNGERAVRRHTRRLLDLLKKDMHADVAPEVQRAMTELFTIADNSTGDLRKASEQFHTNNLQKQAGVFFKVQRPMTGAELAQEIIGPNVFMPRSLRDEFNSIGTNELLRIKQLVNRGLAEGRSRKQVFEDVVKATGVTSFKVKSLIRTTITNTEASAVDYVMRANSDLIWGYRFTAILDSRTSAICSGHDGKVYTLGDNRYRPPLHWNCRSSMIPVMKSKKQLEEENSERLKKEALAKVPDSELTGKAPPLETYSGWLRRQPMPVKVDHLGSEEQVSLFEKGMLQVSDFFTAVGKKISLARLRKLDNARTFSGQAGKMKSVDADYRVEAARPYDLMRSAGAQKDLADMYINDALSTKQAMSLTDYRGTSLIGKRTTRSRSFNEFDERNNQFDPFTGEAKTTLYYDPDFSVYQERLDYLNNSKVLSKDQKEFIRSFAESLEDKIGVNQQSVVVENLRVLFERYANNKEQWGDFATLARKEAQYSVVNVSRILDRRSRARSEVFGGYGVGEDSKVMIMGKYYSFDQLANDMLSDQRYIQDWAVKHGRATAQESYFFGRAPLKAYFMSPDKTKPWWMSKKPVSKQIDKLIVGKLKELPMGDRWAAWYNGEPTETMIQQFIRETKAKGRNIIDMELQFRKDRRNYIESLVSDAAGNDEAIRVLAKVMKTIGSGNATDYDTIAVNIGRSLRENWQPLNPWHKYTLQDYHRDGSEILEGLRRQGKIRVMSRGRVRRSVVDLETGRASGPWKDTVSREVSILDPDMLELQARARKVLIAQRIGTVSARDKLYVVPGKKTYVDARGNDTGISIVTRRASENYDKILVDRDFADMLNHTMNVEYEVDNQFAGFMEDVVRFRDPRGNTKHWDDLNLFRALIIQRGEQGYGFMQTVKWHRQRGKPFTVAAQIDGRGRVYYQGYLSPTGGEVVRPFLNSAAPRQFGVPQLTELMRQTGALIGPAAEALTQAGRTEIFMRHERDILSLGRLLMSETQRDQKVRDFLMHPLVREMEAEEVPKIARLSLEYARVHAHTGGKLNDPRAYDGYETKLMIENDASSSGAQIIGLSTRDRSIAVNSNVLATTQKNRLYDLVAMDTVADPEFQQIEALRGAGITWTDLQKAAKAQNMVSFYGAGKATQAANIEAKFASVLDKKGYLVITKDDLKAVTAQIDKAIKDAEYVGAMDTAGELKALKREIVEVVDGETPVGKQLLNDATDFHPDVGAFVEKLTSPRAGLIGPNDFKKVSEIMSRHLAERAPVTQKFVQFWNAAAKSFVDETQKVDIPWVTFDGKTLYQRYRPKIQTSIEFFDPEAKRMVRNIYEASAEDGKLLGKASISRARIGTGVNGNHMNDASIVRQFHLWGRRSGVPTATIHDAFFTNIGDVDEARAALREIYADAVESETIRNTLLEMKKQGMSDSTYRMLIERAIADGLIDPPNAVTREDILASIPDGWDWYGIGP